MSKDTIDPRNPPKFKVLYDFKAEDEGEMSVKQGDIVVLSPGDDGVFANEDDSKDGWLLVESIRNRGVFGFVPVDYVRRYIEPAVSTPSASVSAANASGASNSQAASQLQSQPLPVPSRESTPGASSIYDAQSLQSTGQAKSGLGASQARQPSASQAAKEPPIRRLSDPRLPQHLLNTLDPQALAGVSNIPSSSSPAIQSSARTPSTSSRPLASPVQKSSPQMLSSGRSKGIPNTPGSSMMMNSSTPSIAAAARLANMDIPRAPGLASAVQSEDFNELFKRNEDYYRKVQSSRMESFQLLTEMIDSLGKKIQTTASKSNDLVKDLQDLDELIDEERRKWKQQNETEKNETARGRTMGLDGMPPGRGGREVHVDDDDYDEEEENGVESKSGVVFSVE